MCKVKRTDCVTLTNSVFPEWWYFSHTVLVDNMLKVAPPKLGGGRTGVFSTRSPHRPNPIGMSLGKLEAVDGTTLVLSGLDIIDGKQGTRVHRRGRTMHTRVPTHASSFGAGVRCTLSSHALPYICTHAHVD